MLKGAAAALLESCCSMEPAAVEAVAASGCIGSWTRLVQFSNTSHELRVSALHNSHWVLLILIVGVWPLLVIILIILFICNK